MPPASCGLRLIQERMSNASVKVFCVPCLRDNYAWVLQDIPTGQLAVVDTPSAKPILTKFQELGLTGPPPVILNTHHHKDHTGGNIELKEKVDAYIVGPKNDHIVGVDRQVVEGDEVRLGSSTCRVIDIPGHTKGHIGYVFEAAGIVFVGDTLFSHGCGALFEGSYSQMWKSLSKIAELPPHFLVFCAHEYTESNLRYALKVFPDDQDILDVYVQVQELRKLNEPTIPSLLDQELRTNPFLRCRSPHFQMKIGETTAVDAFKAVREGKDVWGRGSI
jgi:hydroxyacylglutathione hydrolase